MCGGLGEMMNQGEEETSSDSNTSKWNVLNPLQIQKTRDAVEAARTGNPNVNLGGGTFGTILERNRELQEQINNL